MQSQHYFFKNNQPYLVIVNYKKGMRYIRFYYKKGNIVVNCPFKTSDYTIDQGIEKNFDLLVKDNPFANGEGEDYIYLLGIKLSKGIVGEFTFSDGSKISYLSTDDMHKKLKKWFKKVMEMKTNYYAQMMGTPKYKVSIKNMSSRYGSNSIKTMTIAYSTVLMHFPDSVINSVVVHELAHHFHRDHSKKFYDVVLKYYPDYYKEHTKLRKGELGND